jgi:phospholipid/cholesterol/gamma-HCH transport system substrate-binding protein
MVSRDVKVGIFVLMALGVLGTLVFMIGEQGKIFDEHKEFRAAFKDVQGLTKGSPVRMGGVDIGSVKNLGYGTNSKDDTIYVEMNVVATQAARIRVDSIAEVKGKGLLGDKMIVISVGDPTQSAVPTNGMVKTEESRDIEQIIDDMKNVAAGAERVIINLESTTKAMADEKLHTDVKEAVSNLNRILAAANDGDGYVGRLLNDKAEADRIAATIDSFRGSANELEGSLSGVRKIIDRVQTGPGFVHEVIYEDSGSQAIAQVGGAAEEVGLALKGIREGDSFASKMLYGSESAEMVKNLNLASEDLRQIVGDMKAGKGTLGAFLVDPSVYEDIKVLLGNVGRNRSLRALVRYSIQQDEKSNRVVESGERNEPSDSAEVEATASTP